MAVTLNKKIKKRKINLIIPKGLKHDLIIPNYSNLGYILIILKNNDNDIVVPNIQTTHFILHVANGIYIKNQGILP